jgi:NTP pyrophosphatase (non-canonical NTP hydrolase)
MSDSTITVARLKEKVEVFCSEREWDKYHGAKDLAIGIMTEASELLEHFRFKSETSAEALMKNEETRILVLDEIADVMFFLVRLCQKYDIDLTSALLAKIERNALRYPIDKSKGSNKKYNEL